MIKILKLIHHLNGHLSMICILGREILPFFQPQAARDIDYRVAAW